jgi:predicted RND superfamily exporter protein
MGWQGLSVKLSYENTTMLPASDSSVVTYKAFKDKFGEDGSVLVIGITNKDMFRLDQINSWLDLTDTVSKINGVQSVTSITRAADMVKNDSLHEFVFVPLVTERLQTQAQADSLRNLVFSLPFYEGLLFNPETDTYLMAVTLEKDKLNDKSRLIVTDNIVTAVKKYEKKTGNEIHLSGMPYIRSIMTKKTKSELFLFIFLSIFIAAMILYLFFRSKRVVFSSLIVVAISILFTLGVIHLLGFKISILTGVIPSLMVVIAIENCIYILNKYHWEYRFHGNKIRALTRVIQRIGPASLMVNTATAAGFAAFILVSNQLLREFGIVAAISIFIEYLLCIFLLPIIFSYMAPPTERHLSHLNSKFFGKTLEKIIYLIQYKRPAIFISAGILIVIGVIGMLQLKTSGKVVDDISSKSQLAIDLKYFETNFGGVMPFEVWIDSKKPKAALKLSTIEKIDEMQKEVLKHKEFSKPLSVTELSKFARQAYFNGDPNMYEVPNSHERNFVFSYFPRKADSKQTLLNSFIDSTQQHTRVSFQMADVGTKEMSRLLDSIQPKVAEIFPADKYDVKITGNSVVYTKGTEFLINHLLQSVLIAIGFISLLMVLMFSSVRMIIISMLPNIIPLIITAAIMGFAGVPVKPSTIIIFGIALGISVDNAIQYLSRYRHELKLTGNNIRLSTINALREAGFSMIYTSIVLVLGFSVFIVSSFGGTQALGLLVSTTLFIAMFFNIMVLPSMLLVLDKFAVTKAFSSEPLIEVYDGEDQEDHEEDNHESEHNNNQIKS